LADASYQIRFEAQVLKQLRKIDTQNQLRILAAANLLAQNPRPPAAKKLVGHDRLWRIRVGDYLIIYTIQESDLVIIVVQVGHRRDVYKF